MVILTVLILLAAEARVDERDSFGWTALQKAIVTKGHADLFVRVFLAAGAQVDEKDNFGWTALHKAV